MLLNTTQFYVEKLHYYPAKPQQPMKMRPYEFNANYDAIQTVGGRLMEARTGMVTPSMLNGVTSAFVSPSAVGQDSVINQNWVTSPRYIFMMKVVYLDHTGTNLTSYLIGYTDHDGMSHNGYVNPDMVHHVNNIIETTSYTLSTPLGIKRIEKLYKVYNTFYSVPGTQQQIYTQRPTDVYDVLSVRNLAQIMPSVQSCDTSANLITPYSNNTVTSHNANNITTNYLASILNGGIHAAKSTEIMVPSMGAAQIYSNGGDEYAPRYFDEPSVTDNHFIGAISAASGLSVKQASFRFGSITLLDPTVDSRTHLLHLTKDFANPQSQNTPEVGEHWQGQDMTTVKAFSFIENSVALATKYGFTKMSFIASNMVDVTGTINVHITDFQNFLSLAEEDYAYLLKIFESKFVTEVFLSETNNGMIPVYMECHVNLLGVSKVYLQYGTNPPTWYTAPTYSSGLYNPVITSDHSTMQYSAEEVQKVVDTLTDALQSAPSQPAMVYPGAY